VEIHLNSGRCRRRREAARADRFDVPVVRAAAAAEDVEPGQQFAKLAILRSEFGGIARVEIGARI
jgi:hypothetical protein